MTVAIKTPAELIASIPYLLGFVPGPGSLVYIGLGSGPIARADMTEDPFHLLDMLEPMWTLNAPSDVALVIYTDDYDQALQHASGVTGRVQSLGGRVVVGIQVASDGYRILDGDDTLHPFDASVGVAQAEFVAAGVAPFGTREDAEGRLRTDDEEIPVEAFERAMDTLEAGGKTVLHDAALALQAAMHRFVHDGTLPTDEEIPAMVLALQTIQVRDIVWYELNRTHAHEHVEFLLHLYRRCPQRMTAPVCSLLGFACWLTGSLAPLGWAAVDKALEIEPGYTMAHLVHQTMDCGMNPATWTPVEPEVMAATWESLR